MNDKKTLLNNVGLKLLTRAIELEEKASQQENREDELKYSFMSDGLMEGVEIIEEEIKRMKESKNESIRSEGENKEVV
ncbi:hypothetical protein DRO24_01350 [Candidatus Bathyarchaeota archaeon]|nr:MAG: hypothetical protein DRO24_01350 [Candidatus Bathyarchaeota archaeon]